MSRIPEETIQQVLAATNIVDLVGRYVKLRREGVDYVGLCPFHTERTPSFRVSLTRNRYHCFGCQVSGTAIRFLMEHDGLQFVEAVKRLADAAGIRIEESAYDAEAERASKRRAELKRLHAEVTEEFFHPLLMKHEMAGIARDYLKGRGMNSAIAKNWLMGYAPDKDFYLRRWAADKRYSDELMVEAGLFKRGDDGRTWAHFRHRLMIPIRDQDGAIVAFTARVLDSSDPKQPKYKNSPETPIFSKSRVLFGFDRSKRPIMKEKHAVVIEGQIDLITTFEAGIQNVVASQGTAFTPEHAKMLKRCTSEVVLCFDADDAGFNAAEKAFKVLSPEGITVKVATLPDDEDPDSLIRQKGPEALKAVLARAVDFVEFQITHKRATEGHDLTKHAQLIEQTAVTIAMNPSLSARELLIMSHARNLGVSEDALRRQVEQFVRRRAKSEEKKEAQDDKPKPLTTAQEAQRLLASQHENGLRLLTLALQDAEVLEWLRLQDIEELLHDFPGLDMLNQVWLAHFPAGDETALAAFLARLSAAEESAFSVVMGRRKMERGIAVAKATLEALYTERLKHLIERARAQMRQPGLSPERLDELQKQLMAWHKEYLDRTKPSSDSR